MKIGGILFLAVLAFGLFYLSSCTFGTPSEKNGQEVLNKLIERSHGGIKIISFNKTNGIKDGQYYKLEYKAVFEFMRDGNWDTGTDLRPFVPPSAGAFYVGLGQFNVKTGDRKEISDSILFEKTEKGWRGPDNKIY